MRYGVYAPASIYYSCCCPMQFLVSVNRFTIDNLRILRAIFVRFLSSYPLLKCGYFFSLAPQVAFSCSELWCYNTMTSMLSLCYTRSYWSPWAFCSLNYWTEWLEKSKSFYCFFFLVELNLHFHKYEYFDNNLILTHSSNYSVLEPSVLHEMLKRVRLKMDGCGIFLRRTLNTSSLL